jgi:hypothetical protein
MRMSKMTLVAAAVLALSASSPFMAAGDGDDDRWQNRFSGRDHDVVITEEVLAAMEELCDLVEKESDDGTGAG